MAYETSPTSKAWDTFKKQNAERETKALTQLSAKIVFPDKFRPLLSASIKEEKDFKKLKNWPYIVSPKLDGIRILIDPVKGPVTRSMKPIRNFYLREHFLNLLHQFPRLTGLDGEIVFGPPTLDSLSSPTIFQDTTSAIMAFDGSPKVTFWVFDMYPPTLTPTSALSSNPPYLSNMPYHERYELAENIVNQAVEFLCRAAIAKRHENYTPPFYLQTLRNDTVSNLEELLYFEDQYLQQGFEGIMIRDPFKPYRFGRSSLHPQQQHLIKLKRTQDAEAVIIDFEELYHNDNPAEQDAFGLTERSSSKSNLRPAGRLGALVVEAISGDFKGKTFSIGSGFDTELRQRIWNDRPSYFNQIVTFKYQAQGVKDLPRFPIFKGFRDKEDM